MNLWNVSNSTMWSGVLDELAQAPIKRTGYRCGALRFFVTGSRPAGTDRRGKPIEIKTGTWVDRSKYPGARLRALRKERGCGRPAKARVA
jgi:hypothetical protein